MDVMYAAGEGRAGAAIYIDEPNCLLAPSYQLSCLPVFNVCYQFIQRRESIAF